MAGKIPDFFSENVFNTDLEWHPDLKNVQTPANKEQQRGVVSSNFPIEQGASTHPPYNKH